MRWPNGRETLQQLEDLKPENRIVWIIVAAESVSDREQRWKRSHSRSPEEIGERSEKCHVKFSKV